MSNTHRKTAGNNHKGQTTRRRTDTNASSNTPSSNKKLNPKLLERHGLRPAFGLIRRYVGQLLRDLVFADMRQLSFWWRT